MAAFNWIHFDAMCPNCNRVSHIKCQTHMASDFDGDDTSNFYHQEYQLGDKMAWWPEDHVNFRFWRDDEGLSRDPKTKPPEQAVEACYADCENCKGNLCAVILFENVRPIQVIQIVLEENWPEGFPA